MNVTGPLRTWMLEGPPVLCRPMNFVFSTILRSFQVHHRFMEYEALKVASCEPPCPKLIRSLREPQSVVPLVPFMKDSEQHIDVATWQADWEAIENAIHEGRTPEGPCACGTGCTPQSRARIDIQAALEPSLACGRLHAHRVAIGRRSTHEHDVGAYATVFEAYATLRGSVGD
ncbi:hypothetical protein BD311DRAFT_768014 [Dichomitus squalens]|uniref:Uncharacterized protein n=1 Tax=Dichomitus squalens TaxID=114155 RepID=A0A4Q9M951_9APHY|nr:hypothetical protein BD311DRAFT_768014 [Dichomitus squalens]